MQNTQVAGLMYRLGQRPHGPRSRFGEMLVGEVRAAQLEQAQTESVRARDRVLANVAALLQA